MSSMSQIPPAKLEAIAQRQISHRLFPFLGPYLIGMIADAILFGVIIQMYIRWHTYSRKEDRKVVRWLVWYLMFFGVVSSAFLVAWIFHLFVFGFGTYAGFFRLDRSLWWFIINALGRLPVSIFFAHRAFEMLGRNKPFAIIIGLLFFTTVATSIPVKILFRQQPKLVVALILLHHGCVVIGDIVVTVTIAICLMRSKTGWKDTDRLIKRLLFLVVQTQLPPTVFVIIFLGIFVKPETRPMTSFYICAPKIDITCLMVVLNSRQKLRKDLSIHQSFPMSNTSGGSKNNTPSLSYTGPPSVGGRPRPSTHINVTTETVTQRSTLMRPKYSINRTPIDLELQSQTGTEKEKEEEGGTETDDKDSMEGRMNSTNSSKVRLTGGKGV